MRKIIWPKASSLDSAQYDLRSVSKLLAMVVINVGRRRRLKSGRHWSWRRQEKTLTGKEFWITPERCSAITPKNSNDSKFKRSSKMRMR